MAFDKGGTHDFRKFERRRNLVRRTFRELIWVEALEYDGRADIAEAEFICNTTSLTLIRACASQCSWLRKESWFFVNELLLESLAGCLRKETIGFSLISFREPGDPKEWLDYGATWSAAYPLLRLPSPVKLISKNDPTTRTLETENLTPVEFGRWEVEAFARPPHHYRSDFCVLDKTGNLRPPSV